MKVEMRKVGSVFPQFEAKSKQVADLEVPYGIYEETEEDVQLQSLIPREDENYKFPMWQLLTLLAAFQDSDNVLLTGPTGVGKTMLPMQLCSKLNIPATRINCHGDMTSAELFGFMMPDGFVFPSIVKGIQRPGILIIDEWDTLRPELGVGLQRLLEDADPGIYISELDKFFPKHKNCIVVATANTTGLGDATGLYAGTQSQNFASQNRFHLIVKMEPLDKDNMRAVLKGIKINNEHAPTEVVDNLVGFYEAIVNAYNEQRISSIVSVRNMVQFLRYFLRFKTSAYNLCVAEKFPVESDKAIARELAERFNLAKTS